MTMQTRFPTIAVPCLALFALTVACAPVDRDKDADPTLGAPAVEILGDGQSCINRSQIRQTLVRNDQVIDFEMRGGKVYRNVLTSPCPGLGVDRAITYNTTIDQLCSPEIIYVLQNFGGRPQRGAACGLGKFVPVKYVRGEKDKED